MGKHIFHKLLPLICACLLFTTAFTPLSASRLTASSQNTRPGTARLDSVLVAGSIRFTSEQIATAIGLHPAKSLAATNCKAPPINEPLLGLFTNIQFRFSSLAGGVKVTYQVSDVPALPVTFDNFPWLSDEELSAGLKNSGILWTAALLRKVRFSTPSPKRSKNFLTRTTSTPAFYGVVIRSIIKRSSNFVWRIPN